jgi:hypothetical protein
MGRDELTCGLVVESAAASLRRAKQHIEKAKGVSNDDVRLAEMVRALVLMHGALVSASYAVAELMNPML